MQPIGSQAGSHAIVDARALTGALTATTDPIEALAQYDAERRPAMNDITSRNRGFGPEAAMQLVEERAPPALLPLQERARRSSNPGLGRSG
jgi:2-polyprenyl-6-methoxyphenol hydroxylase-like FAD-dependent oxidoreductase